MKREEIVHIAITKDEMRELMVKMNDKMLEDGKRYTTSTYLREFLLKPHLNHNSSPSEDTEQETLPEKTLYDDLEL